MDEQELTEKIIGSAFAVHNELGVGFLESVYEKALVRELADRGLRTVAQYPVNVRYKGDLVGHFIADLLVEDRVIVELKAVEALGKSHEVQLVNYLKATGIEVGLILNFGTPKLGIKRKVRSLDPVDLAHPVILSHPSKEQA